jgi:hypothetical protein
MSMAAPPVPLPTFLARSNFIHAPRATTAYDPALTEAVQRADRWQSEYQELLRAHDSCADPREDHPPERSEGAERPGAHAVGGTSSRRDRNDEPEARGTRFSAEKRDPSPATSAVERARLNATALQDYMLGGRGSAASESSYGTDGERKVTPAIVEPDMDDLFGEYGIFTGTFVDPAAKGRKLRRRKERGIKNRARKERNKKRASNRRAGGEYETDSNLSDSSGDCDHLPKSRPGSGRHLENLRIDGGFPGCRNIKEWDIYVSTQCYNAAGHTDKLEFTWLDRVLKIPDSQSMSFAIVPDEKADLDKMLLRALRRE